MSKNTSKNKSASKKGGKKKSAAHVSKKNTVIEESSFLLKPLHDRVIIKEDTESKERQTATGIIIPITVSDDKGSKRGEVVAVGSGRVEEGKLIPLSVKVGDTVLFQWGDKVKVNEAEYYIVRESEILAIVR